MSNYTPIVDYAAKDVLLTGDPSKRILGTEISAELTSIAGMSASKEDVADKDAANGYAGLGADAKLPDATLSANVPLLDVANTFAEAAIFLNGLELKNNVAILRWNELDADADEKVWRLQAQAGNLNLLTRTDADGAGASVFSISRTGTTPDLFTLELPLGASSGTNAAPSMTFSVDLNTGLYRYGADEIGVTLAGAAMARFAGTALFVDKIEFGSVTQTDTTVTRNSAGHLAVEGQVIWDASNMPLAHGTYTPTINNTTNVAASTPRACQYSRVGNTVTVSGEIDVDPTASAVQTVLGVSLPIASDFAQTWQCAGMGVDDNLFAAGIGNWFIKGDVSNNRATLQNEGVSGTNNRSVRIHFTYLVV